MTVNAIHPPLNALAGVVLDRFLDLAPGDPTRPLDDPRAWRVRQLTGYPDEVGLLDEAVRRMRTN